MTAVDAPLRDVPTGVGKRTLCGAGAGIAIRRETPGSSRSEPMTFSARSFQGYGQTEIEVSKKLFVVSVPQGERRAQIRGNQGRSIGTAGSGLVLKEDERLPSP